MLEGLRALPARLSDTDLAAVRRVAEMQLAPLPPCDPAVLEEELLAMATLPRRKADQITGALMVETYSEALAGWPKGAIKYLRSQSIATCKFLPSPSECLEILRGWERRDAQAKGFAKALMNRENQHRFGEAMKRLKWGEMDRAEFDTLPEEWKRSAEGLGYCRGEVDPETEATTWIMREAPYAAVEDRAA